MKIGFHMQVAKGFDAALKEAERLDCRVIQIFLKNPRSWNKKTFGKGEMEAFKRLSAHVPVVGHLSYLPNLAKIGEDERHLSGFLHEIQLCETLGVGRLVIHLGSNRDRREGISSITRSINRALSEYGITLLLENCAGQGAAIGCNAEEIASVYEGVDADKKERVLVCIDTAHLFQSGCDVRKKTAWNTYLTALDENIGREKIGFFHLNDSKTTIGSHIDRHWHIGKGEIGVAFFRSLLKDKRFAHLEGVMETPKMGNMDEENMRTMRSLLSPLVSRSLS